MQARQVLERKCLAYSIVSYLIARDSTETPRIPVVEKYFKPLCACEYLKCLLATFDIQFAFRIGATCVIVMDLWIKMVQPKSYSATAMKSSRTTDDTCMRKID